MNHSRYEAVVRLSFDAQSGTANAESWGEQYFDIATALLRELRGVLAKGDIGKTTVSLEVMSLGLLPDESRP